MNLLSLIIIFLAVVICAAIAFIAWELTREAGAEKPVNESPVNKSPAAEAPAGNDPEAPGDSQR
mgnify:CR=1 FL=1